MSPETTNRILWAIPWAALAITIIVAGGEIFAGAIFVIAAICISELFHMAKVARPFPAVAMLAAGALIAAAYFGDQFQMVLALVATFPVLFVFVVLRGRVTGVTGAVAVTVLGIVWIGLPFAHAVLLIELPEHGQALLIDVLVATIVADTAAYAGGRAFGRHPLAAAISPSKTVEGLLFGVAGGTAAFWFAGLYQDWLPGAEALAMGAAIALVAPIGDLFESTVKRDLGVKDSGTAVGPHGGLLDRLDAVLFTITAGYYLAVLFLY
ncbi:MAG: phosphatidate cytidylyltransferase [Actinomycetota bacterium]|nr:phosphatidate cytidylyltransferase [Actinomycetota bacterium]